MRRAAQEERVDLSLLTQAALECLQAEEQIVGCPLVRGEAEPPGPLVRDDGGQGDTQRGRDLLRRPPPQQGVPGNRR